MMLQYVPKLENNNIAALIEGHVEVSQEGRYELCLDSDDGSRLVWDKTVLIDNDQVGSRKEKCVQTKLQSGKYTVAVWLFNNGGTPYLKLKWRSGEMEMIYLILTL